MRTHFETEAQGNSEMVYCYCYWGAVWRTNSCAPTHKYFKWTSFDVQLNETYSIYLHVTEQFGTTSQIQTDKIM